MLMGDERGMTLVEVLVASLISSILFLAGMDLLVVTVRGADRVQERTELSVERGRVSAQVTKALRGITCPVGVGSPLGPAERTWLSFYSDLDDSTSVRPVLRQVAFLDTRLVLRVRVEEEDRWSERTLVDQIAPGTGELTYRRSGGEALTVPLDREDLGRVTEIEVAYARRRNAGEANAVRFSAFAGDGRAPTEQEAVFGCIL